jgi:hypothetical protein
LGVDEKNKEKEEIDNRTISAKYITVRTNLKKQIEKLILNTQKDLKKLEKVKSKNMNQLNEKLLNKKMTIIISFKEKLIDSWKETFGEEEY